MKDTDFMGKIEDYYNKFNEDKRLDSRHGRVEFIVSMKYIHEALSEAEMKYSGGASKACVSLLDLGAGTGRYSVPLAEEGYDVTAVELVKHNLGRLKQKSDKVKAYQGNAMKLKRFSDNTFDVTLVFGPMYHLHKWEEKLAVLSEAKRVTKPGGKILVAYVMNEYSVLLHAFRDKNVLEAIKTGMLDESFHTTETANELYSFVRTEDIYRLSDEVGLTREKIISPDGPANHMRRELNALSEEEFEAFVNYQLAVCERMDLIGAGGHTVDILRV